MPHSTSHRSAAPARLTTGPPRGTLRTTWVLPAACAVLVPLVVALAVLFTDDGPARVALPWVIALLTGAAVVTAREP
jgi:hypothetical protein